MSSLPLTDVYAQVRLTTEGDFDIDFSGFTSIKARLNLGAGDEFTIVMPAQTIDGAWRGDMPIWMTGASINFHAGYDGNLDLIQSFEVVSSTTNYADGGGEVITVRGVSDLARTGRNKDPRTFNSGSDAEVLTEIANEYGWNMGVTTPLFDPTERLKEAGKSDLDFLKRIAREARLGGPRVDETKTLIMPEPKVGPLKFRRGPIDQGSGFRRLHSLNMNRDGGHQNTRVTVVSFDPKTEQFIEVEFEANRFGGDPIVTYEGPVATKGLKIETTTQGLTLAVIERRGHGKRERVDVLSSGRFLDATSAEDLVARWFDLREKLSRWATAKVDGRPDLKPYEAVTLDGNIAEMDKGIWLPIWVEHNIGMNGWLSNLRVIRVVSEPVITPT